MDKLAKSILMFMEKQPKGTACQCSLRENWDYISDISISDLSKAVNATPDDTLAAIAYLVEQNLAAYGNLQTRNGPAPITFHLKHEGLHYREISQLAKKEQWKERAIGFFSGIAVTVLAGLLIEWLLK